MNRGSYKKKIIMDSISERSTTSYYKYSKFFTIKKPLKWDLQGFS